jgi:hypothetical protein
MSANANQELDEMASAYVRFLLRGHSRIAEPRAILVDDRTLDDFESDLEIDSMGSNLFAIGGNKAWELIRRIVERLPPDEAVLSFFGAGALEYHWCSEERILSVRDTLDAWLGSDPKAMSVFRSCWSDSPPLEQLLAKHGGRQT